MRTRNIPFILLLCIAIVLTSSSTLFAIGSGGLLNIVPQARVSLSGEQKEWAVYVHPFEGSVLVIPNDSDTCYALDKNKKHAIKIAKSSIKFQSTGVVDVPEDSPYTILKYRPEFGRLFAKVALDDGRMLIVDVER